MEQYPSIFNDVIGPVMIGPSSSHTAASVRIGNFIRQLAGDRPVKRLGMSCDPEGSLAATYHTQMSDRALLAGILGLTAHDPDMLDAFRLATEAGVAYEFTVKPHGPGHPNTYYLDFATQQGESVQLVALSVGGGMFRITEYQGFPVDIDGGFYESLLICAAGESGAWRRRIAERLSIPYALQTAEQDGRVLIEVRTEQAPDWGGLAGEGGFTVVQPVLPVRSQLRPDVPFVLGQEIGDYAAAHGGSLSDLALRYESARSGLSPEQVLDKMLEIVAILRASLAAPPTPGPAPRILPNQSQLLAGRNLLGGEFCRSVIYYVTKFMDIKTSLGVFVAAPTAGSCSCLPGTVFALAGQLGLDDRAAARALLAGGLAGVVIARLSTFAAEVCGCQAECGAGSGMCAAACSEMLGATAEQGLAAASLALQNVFGMICDPVGRKVEVPCLGKNMMCAFNAVASANMAYCGFAEVIPLDETVAAMYAVGRALPRELRCTGLGGLSTTPSGLRIDARLAELDKQQC